MKKKRVVLSVALVIYLVLITAVFCNEKFIKKNYAPSGVQQVDTNTGDDDFSAEGIKRKLYEADNNPGLDEAYNNAIKNCGYDYSKAPIKIDKEDCQSIIEANKLPALVRMAEEDRNKYMSELQVLKKIEVLKADVKSFEMPEFNWKNTYNRIYLATQDKQKGFNQFVSTDVTKASEINKLISSSDSSVIKLTADRILLDEPIKLKSGVAIDGNGVEFYGVKGAPVDFAFLAEDCDNIKLMNINLQSPESYGYGVYIIRTNNFVIENCTIANSIYKGLVIMGECKNFMITDNTVKLNGNGAVFMDGNISDGIISGNTVKDNFGTRNLTAGIVMSSMAIDDYYTAYNEFKDEHLYDLTKTPHNIVIYQNNVIHNNSSGVYSDGGYNLYIIENIIYNNDKEGMCLDYGTFGSYVSNNVVRENGGRLRQSDEDLEADFVTSFGRLEDGSSPAKLPGISIDNSAYNFVVNNNVSENYGSGVKCVRSAYRNLVLENTITDNNKGRNKDFHFFGIEVGYASTPDEPVKGLDFTACFENIFAKNIVTGKHYSGAFLQIESYCNDVFDNIINDAVIFQIECHSNKFNSITGNLGTGAVLNEYR